MQHARLACTGLVMFFLAGMASAQQINIPPPVDRSGSQKAAADMKAAEAEMQKASVAMSAAQAAARKEAESSANWKAAAEALKTAQTEYDAVRKPVFDALKAKPEYQKAKAEKEKADAERDAIINSDTSTPDQRINAATSVMTAGAVVSRMESDAMAAEPKCAEAKAKLTAASQAVEQLEKEFKESVKNNPNFTTARTNHDAAKQRLDQARQHLAQCRKQEADAERARQEQIRQLYQQAQQQKKK